MNKLKINLMVDLIALASFVVTAITSLLILFFMPSGVRQGGFQEFMGLSKNFWSDIHEFFGVIFIATATAHILLHLDWFSCTLKNIFREQEQECKKKE